MADRKIQLVIFDLDGTLVDAYTAVASSVNYMLEQLGRPAVDDERIKKAVGWGIRYLIAQFVDADDVDKGLSIYRQHHAHALKSGTSFLPGAKKLLRTLKDQGYQLAVASNRPARFTHIILKHLKINQIFDYVVCGDEVARPKSAPDMLEHILTRCSLDPMEALYVGDMTIDVETGRAAGVNTVTVITGSSDREEIERLNPLRIMDNISEVTDILAGENISAGS